MAAPHLPDELVSEILRPVLSVPEETFASTAAVSPFSAYRESSSAYLLVCKSWLRVGTPLLYNVIIIRSKDQAKALARTFSENQDANLGRFVRKLRIDSGYGNHTAAVLQSTPKLLALCLSLEIWKPDTVTATCRALRFVSPTALILRERRHWQYYQSSKMRTQLSNGVADAIHFWPNLTALHLNFSLYPEEKISTALIRSQRLQTISLSVEHLWMAEVAWRTLSTSCPLKVIHVDSEQDLAGWRNLQQYPELGKLLSYKSSNPPQTLQPESTLRNPFYVPMADASVTAKRAIWSRALYYAMQVPERNAWNPTAPLLPSARKFLLVSKQFHQLGLPHLYAHVLLLPHISSSFAAAIRSARPAIQSLSVQKSSIYRGQESLSWGTFVEIARVSGHSLRRCDVGVMPNRYNSQRPAFDSFEMFHVLEDLAWNSKVPFSTAHIPDEFCLVALRSLSIFDADRSFLRFLSQIRSLCLSKISNSYYTTSYWHGYGDWYDVAPRMDFDPLFLVHGPKLLKLDLLQKILSGLNVSVLDLCPNLVSLIIRNSHVVDGIHHNDALQASANIVPSSPHSRLQTISVPWKCRSMAKPKNYNSWELLFAKFDRSLLPSLQEIRSLCLDQWPTDEHAITKDAYIPWAELLLRRNLHLTDRDGRRWRPRLRVKGRV
ncbi:hypothetical protein C8F01DRAFT_1144090 [Mycena amicta]|nr:hypothetical protein C8F01DRAFT_1144090 [Mycena amicta]